MLLFVVSHTQRIGCQPEKNRKLLYTVANPARGLLNRGGKKKGMAAHFIIPCLMVYYIACSVLFLLRDAQKVYDPSSLCLLCLCVSLHGD